MATTSYFEQSVTALDNDGNSDKSRQHVLVVGVGLFTGREELYLSLTDRLNDEHCAPAIVLDRDTAQELLGSLQQAMRHLRYLD